MTRQNSRPPKKKQAHNKTSPKKRVVQHRNVAALDVFISSSFEPSLALKSEILSKRRNISKTDSTWRPHPGTLFSYGQGIIGTKKGRDTYTIRITKKSAAVAIIDLPAGTRIRLNNPKFVNSYGSKKYREISASSYEVITEKPRTRTSATPSIKWIIYPTEFGIKQKNKLTLHRPLLMVTVCSSSSN